MNQHKTDKLFNKFPTIYRERLMTTYQSEMPWGFQCGDGWYDIIHNLSLKLEKIAGKCTNKDSSPAVSEVRSGGDKLIFRIRNSDFKIDSLVFESMQKCAFTCENCGYAPAFLQNDHIIKNQVVCNRCYGKKKSQATKISRLMGKVRGACRET